MLKTQPIPYDYGPYDGELAMMLQGQAERIRARITKQTADMLETGRDLLAVRGELDHGRFEGWVETACRISPRLARMYMRAAEWADNECEYRKLVSDLEPTAVIELAKKSTPDTVRCAVADQLKAGRPVHTRTVRELATTAREARKSDETDGPKEKPETVAELRVIMERQAKEIDKLKKRLAKADETIAEKEAQRAAQESRANIAARQVDEATNRAMFAEADKERLSEELERARSGESYEAGLQRAEEMLKNEYYGVAETWFQFLGGNEDGPARRHKIEAQNAFMSEDIGFADILMMVHHEAFDRLNDFFSSSCLHKGLSGQIIGDPGWQRHATSLKTTT